MTPEERLDRLTGRHEALTQSVELLYAAQQLHDERMEKLVGVVEKLVQLVENHERRIDHLEGEQ
jgi:hypothetical protein